MNDEELANWLEAARQRSPWQQFAAKVKARLKVAAAVGMACLAGGFGLSWLGMDGHLAIRAMTLAGPVMAAGLLVFLRRACGQNFIALPLAADLATTEPADLTDDLASDLAKATGRPVTVPASQPTVKISVLSMPANYAPIRLHPTPEQLVADYMTRRPAITNVREDPDGDD